jgi:insertion element IS1 protein InsB
VLDAVVGARDEATGARLFTSLARHCFQLVCTDYYHPYRNLVPIHLHYRSKAETTSVESCNSLLRHYLARFRRKTKCYSKCKKMLLQAVLLLRAKKNGTLSMLL